MVFTQSSEGREVHGLGKTGSKKSGEHVILSFVEARDYHVA